MISSDTFSIPFSLSSPENPVMCRLAHFILSYRSNVLFQFKKIVFLSAVLVGWFPLFYLPNHWPFWIICLLLIAFSVVFVSAILTHCYSDLHFCQQPFLIPSVFLLPLLWTHNLVDWRSMFHYAFRGFLLLL